MYAHVHINAIDPHYMETPYLVHTHRRTDRAHVHPRPCGDVPRVAPHPLAATARPTAGASPGGCRPRWALAADDSDRDPRAGDEQSAVAAQVRLLLLLPLRACPPHHRGRGGLPHGAQA